MKTSLTTALMFALFTSVCAQDSTVVFDPRFSEVRAFIIGQVTEEGVPSIVVAVAEDGEIAGEEAFGWSDVVNRVRATPHTMYRLGSIAKPITATPEELYLAPPRVTSRPDSRVPWIRPERSGVG